LAGVTFRVIVTYARRDLGFQKRPWLEDAEHLDWHLREAVREDLFVRGIAGAALFAVVVVVVVEVVHELVTLRQHCNGRTMGHNSRKDSIGLC
jgi:hypothetical protein